MKKRILAIILGLSMVFQTTALAAPLETESLGTENPVVQEVEEKTSDVETVFDDELPPSQGIMTVQEDGAEEPGEVVEEQPEATANVNFELQLQLDFPISQERLDELSVGDLFIVGLHSKTGNEEEPDETDEANHVHAKLKTVTENLLVFQAEDVKPGDYKLTLEAEYYFQDFEQDVTIKEGTKTTLVFSDSYLSDRGEGKTSPGVYALGDLNADKVIDKADSEVLLTYMGQSSTQIEVPDNEDPENPSDPIVAPNPEYNYIYDLNQDGNLDIGDLGILVYNMDKESKAAIPIETVSKSAVKVEKEQEKAVPVSERKLDSIMDDAKEPIQIAPQNSEAVISEENPVEINMEFSSATVPTAGIVISAPAERGPAEGTITVTCDDPDAMLEEEKEIQMEIPIVDEGAAAAASARRARARVQSDSQAKAIRKADGSIVIDLGAQIAIKKVTILVTKTAANLNLTEIGKVEFLNDMESRIPEPELNIPSEIKVDGKGDNFTVSWNPEVNVTGYKVYVSAVDKDGNPKGEQEYNAGVNQVKVSSFTGGVKDKITPLWTYSVKVKSTNGEWSSPYSEVVTHYQRAGEAPEAPDNVSINGKYRQLDVSWKDMPGTEKYTLEYREKGTDTYTIVNDIMTNRYSITGLGDGKEYQVRVYGWNHDDNDAWRRGPYSVPALGKTSSEAPKFPKYKMITRDQIESITPRFDAATADERAKNDPEYLIDGDYSTYGYSYAGGAWGADVTFKETFTFKEMIMTNRLEDKFHDDPNWDYSGVSFTMFDESGKEIASFLNGQVVRQDLHPTAKNTIRFIMPQAVEGVKRVRFSLIKYGFGCANGRGNSISEINFFEYDSLESDVYGLYTDTMHIDLKEDVTAEKIAALKKRAGTLDAKNNEYHPKKALLESEIEYAELLLNSTDIPKDIVDVKAYITKGGLGRIQFSSGLCGIQPLGYVAAAESEVNVYVGQQGKAVGDTVDARVVFTQYHAESSAWRSGEYSLKQGMNTIKVPNISNIDNEKGGSMYIVHTNPNNVARNPIKVRVSGARKIPKLDLHRNVGNERFTIPETEWKEKISAYVDELEAYVAALPEKHSDHLNELNNVVNDGQYDERNCFLNYTEISLDNVLLSVPAAPILSGISRNNADRDAKVQNMYDTVVAMNQLLELFYKERGLNPGQMNGVQGIPSARFNIRYQRMFAGAFMYAGGLHTGIEYDSVAGMATGTPVVADENGKYISGQLFGWGIAHELGHNADGGRFSFAEVTNNIWAQFGKTHDTKDTSRIPYEAVYKHVTSNTVGKPGNVFADLGMYWQLHLAYDKNYVHYNYYKDGFTWNNYKNMRDNEFMARFYAIRREWEIDPKPGGIALSEGSTEQNIMRTACAAAEKNLLDYFRAWGWEPDAQTIRYAEQYSVEERKIQYLNDGAHEYTLAHPDPIADGMTSKNVEVDLKQGTGKDARKVTLTISLPEETKMDAVLGYEILRNGKPVAFVEPTMTEDGNYAAETVYEDVIATANNRVMIYEVVAYDKHLNTTEKKTLDAIKIRHEGDLPTDNWTVVTNAVSEAGVLHVDDETTVVEGKEYTDVVTGKSVTYNSDMDIEYRGKYTGEVVKTVSAANKVFNGDKEHGYVGVSSSGNAYIDIDLGGKQQVLGLKYIGDAATPNWKFSLEYSDNGRRSFTRIMPFEIRESEDGYPTLYFKNNGNVRAVTATHIRIVSQQTKIGIKDLQLIGPSGDNVDIGISTINEDDTEEWNTNNAIGILDKDYVLDEAAGEVIPEGSFIVTGKYTGNAAYNVVKLYNQNRDICNDSFENKLNSIINGYQSIFAEMPDEGSIVNVKDGFWVYWLEPLEGGGFGLPGAGENGEDVQVELPTKVYAELYRVDNAETLAGERLVSDSFMVNVPTELPRITLTGNQESGNQGSEGQDSGDQTEEQTLAE